MTTPSPTMTGAQLHAARRALHYNAATLGRVLGLKGRDPGRDVRRWETGEIPEVPGPVAVAVALMLRVRELEAAHEPSNPAPYQDATEPPKAAPAPPLAAPDAIQPTPKPKTRRRG